MALHPVGPLPVATYWRRRAALLLAVVVVLLVGRSCLSGGSPTKSKAEPRVTPSSSSSPTSQPETPVSGASCPDSSLKVDTTTDSSAYPVGGAPKITLTVTNTSAVPCTRDLGSGAIELVVKSGQERIWSSDDCGPSRAVSIVTLAPSGAKVVRLTWAGKRSAPQCGGTKAQAQPGTYYVVARIGTLRASGAVFHFRAA